MAAEPNQMENVRNERIKGVWRGRGDIPRDETWTANELANVIGSYWSLFSPPSLFLREEITVGFTDTAVQKWLLFLLFKHHAFFEVINGLRKNMAFLHRYKCLFNRGRRVEKF